MPKNDKNQQTILMFLTLLEIIILVFVVIITNHNVFIQAYALKTLEEITTQTSGLDNNNFIDVGPRPEAIAINVETDIVYVANSLWYRICNFWRE